ncbi:hypothetical protein ACLMJK_005666 [Lecanora helva]
MTELESSIGCSAAKEPKAPRRRVILRLRVNEFEGEGREWEQSLNAIQVYFQWAGLGECEGVEGRKNYWTVTEPFQAEELRQTSFHVVINIHYGSPGGPSLKNIPHELYPVRRKPDGSLEVRPYPNPLVAQDILSKIRHFSDDWYPYAGWRSKEYLEEQARLVEEAALIREAAREKEAAAMLQTESAAEGKPTA